MQFIQRIFADISVDHKVAERKIWPPIFTGQCPGVAFKDNTAFNKVHAPGFTRGLILAHRQIWDEFAWQHKDAPNGTLYEFPKLIVDNVPRPSPSPHSLISPLTPRYESPKLIVFEDDAMEIDARAPDMAYQVRFRPPGYAFSSPGCPHLQAHQPSLCTGHYLPGTALARLDMLSLALEVLISRPTNPPSAGDEHDHRAAVPRPLLRPVGTAPLSHAAI